MLHMAARVIWGPLKTPGGHDHHGHSQADQGQAASPGGHDDGESRLSPDLNGREMGILIPLAVVVIVLGIIPGKLLRTLEPPVDAIVGRHDPLRQPTYAKNP
jgi:NADH-quinone oxidoreductase subunit M